MSREKTQHALNSLLWADNRYLPDTVNPRCRGRPLDPELYLSCVCNLFCRGFRCILYFRVARNKHVSAYRGRGSFLTVTFSWSLPQNSNIAYKQALGGWGEGVREEKGREKSSFPAHSTPRQLACRLRKTRIIKVRFPSYLGIVFIPPLNVMYLRNAFLDSRSLVPRHSRLGQSWTLPWAVTSTRDTRQEPLARSLPDFARTTDQERTPRD